MTRLHLLLPLLLFASPVAATPQQPSIPAGGPPLAAPASGAASADAFAPPPDPGVPGGAVEDPEPDLAEMAARITRGARTEKQRASAIYRWLAANITYDTERFLAGMPGDTAPEHVLRTRRTICHGFSLLYERLGALAGLEVATIIGYAKGYGYKPEQRFTGPNHAWNAVRIDGRWHLLDVTWAAGRIVGRDWVRQRDDFWFLTPPDAFAFTHLPVEERWQLVQDPLSLEEFTEQVVLSPVQLAAGFAPEYVRALMESSRFEGVPEVFATSGSLPLIHNVPLERRPVAGARDFRLEVPGAESVVVVNGDRRYFLRPTDGVFGGRVRLLPGPLRVTARFPGGGGEYWPVLVYGGVRGR